MAWWSRQPEFWVAGRENVRDVASRPLRPSALEACQGIPAIRPETKTAAATFLGGNRC
jgi:hypothetical protein